MIIKPKTRGFICSTSHPVGCARNVLEQIEYVKKNGAIEGAKKVLVIGASTGYGLASRIASAFGSGAATIGVFFDRPASGNKPATPGWYNTAAFEEKAIEMGLYAKSINGDAFSSEIKEQVIETIKKDLGSVDLVVYSLASPRRQHPLTGEVSNSVLKPIGDTFKNKTVNFHTGEVSEVTIEPADEIEIKQTVDVMGGEDWQMWIEALKNAGVLEKGIKTVAYSYIGPKITHAVYREGTIGRAKDHLEDTAKNITKALNDLEGKAYVSVNKALVTQASSAIPVVPLYISILYKVMKEKGTHEGCIEQIYRLYKDFLFTNEVKLDEDGRIRVDDLEMDQEIQDEVSKIWEVIETENVDGISDIKGYREDFFKLFGFELSNVNYEEDISLEVEIPSIK